MLSIVLLSISTAFAAEDVAADDVIAVDDEIIIDEPLAVEEDNSIVSANESSATLDNVVTKDTFSNYFDENGTLLPTVTADEITFSGDIADVGVNTIVLDRSVKVVGENAVLKDIAIDVKASDVVISGLTINQNNGTAAISIMNASNVEIENTVINFNAVANQNGYAINSELANNLSLINNAITYVGATTGWEVNYGVRVANSNNAIISGNKFKFTLLSAAVGWAEVPAGSGNWVSSPITEGIVVDNSNDVILDSNNISVDFNGVIGSYDTIYSVDFRDSANAVITNNVIDATGNTYIYGIIITGDDFTIRANNVTSVGAYYANGIDVEGPSTGVVEDNVVEVKAPTTAYAIYSGMNGADVKANYTGNVIKGEAYNIFGFSSGDIESNIVNNTIALNGNYTTGIAYRGSTLVAESNNIVLNSSEVGNESIWEGFGVEAVGIKVVQGNATIKSNVIAGPGKGVSVSGASTGVELTENVIDVVANADKDAYAIYATNVPTLTISNNAVAYKGTTAGTGVNNAVYLNNATGAVIAENTFDLELVASYVPWAEVPAGSGNWVSSPVSEGIVVADSNGVIFDNNAVNVTFDGVVGSYDTIYSVDFKGSNDAVIANNVIDATGNTYIYGIIITGDNFTIKSNNISSVGAYYANGIDVEGPATGVVEDNVVEVKAPTTAYAIYSGMNGADVKANYTGNVIKGEAYNIFGFSSADVESNIVNNTVDLKGNYTTGIAYRGSKLTLDGNTITLNSSEIGNESIWEGFGVEAVGIKVINGNATIKSNVIAGPGKGVSVSGASTGVELTENVIDVVANADKDAYAIYASDIPALTISNNTVAYKGTTAGTGINNAVYLNNATGAVIAENTFDLELVASYVPWAEVPAGTGNWVSSPVSEGIVVEDSDNVVFDSNSVNVAFDGVVGSYDTIYSVDFKGSDNAVIANNVIDATGNTYIYGIIITGDNFTIKSNNISSVGAYYANGIDVEGPSTGVVEDNVVEVKAPTTAYAIYSGMNGADVKANYTGNVIKGEAYNIFGFSSADVESNIVNNTVDLKGNYTTGIAYRGSNLTVDGNTINVEGSNVGNESIWESFGVETVGIKVSTDATIINNDVKSTGEFAVKVADTKSSVHDNYLLSDKLKGDKAVNATGDAEIYNNTPSLKSILAISDMIMQIGDGSQYVVVLKDEDNNPIANADINVEIGNVKLTNTTDEKGVAKFDLNLTVGNYTAVAVFDGQGNYAPIETTSTIIVNEVVPTRIDTIITVDPTFTRVANDYAAGERGDFFYAVLTDINGKPLANVTVQIAVNGPIYNITTDEQGRAGLRVNLAEANTYTYALSFQGNDKYNAAPLASSKLTVTKKSTSITASAKTFKAKAKTKKISVTLKTVKNKYDGKTYLLSGKKITLKINGKTYTAKINKKGVATFSIKLTKKGKFTAAIKFAGDKTYKASSKKIKVTIK